MTDLRAGDIVRVSEESMHYDFFMEEDFPLEGVLLEIDLDMEPEEMLVEFYEERRDLHDGGWGDGKRCRYWLDHLDLIESGGILFRKKEVEQVAQVLAEPLGVREARGPEWIMRYDHPPAQFVRGMPHEVHIIDDMIDDEVPHENR